MVLIVYQVSSGKPITVLAPAFPMCSGYADTCYWTAFMYSAFLILRNHASDCFNGLLSQDITINLPVWSLLPHLLLLLTRSEDKAAHKLYGHRSNENKLHFIHWLVFTLIFAIMLMFITFVHVCASFPTDNFVCCIIYHKTVILCCIPTVVVL